jgi:hypothetical protein
MEKSWYIVVRENHFGPYHVAEIEELLGQNKINENTQLFDQKTQKKIFVKNVFPSAQTEIKKQLTQSAISAGRERREKIYQKTPQPFKSTEQTLVSISYAEKPKRSIDFSGAIKNIRANAQTLLNQPWWNYFKQVIALALLVAMFPTYYGIQNHRLNLSRPSGMSEKDFVRFQSIVKDKEMKRGYWKLLFSKDFKQLWLGTNIPGKLTLQMKIQGKPGSVLSKTPIEAVTTVTIEKNLASLESLFFSQGTKIVPGQYQVTLALMEHKQTLWNVIFDPQKKYQQSYQTDILVGVENKNSLQKLAKEFFFDSQSLATQLGEDITQKYQSLAMINNRLQSFFRLIPAYKNSQELDKYMRGFKDEYQRQYGSFFTNMVIENDKRTKELTQKVVENKTNMITHYKQLSSLAQKMGSASMDIFADYKKLKLNPPAFSKVLARFEALNVANQKQLQQFQQSSPSPAK